MHSFRMRPSLFFPTERTQRKYALPSRPGPQVSCLLTSNHLLHSRPCPSSEAAGPSFPLPPCRIAIRDPKGLRLHKRPPTAWIIATLRLVSWWTVSAASHQNRTTSSSSCAKDKQTS